MCAVAIVSGAFVAGMRVPRRTPAPAPAAAPAAETSCIDRHAMEANAALAGDAVDCHGALARVRAEARSATEAAALRARSATSLAESLGMSSDDWANAAQTGAVVLRSPCRSFRHRPTTEVFRPNRRTMGGISAAADKSTRAEAAGLTPEELSAFDDAYRRAHERTWAKMKASCEALVEEKEDGEEELSVADRIAQCRRTALGAADRSSVARVAELRAARRPPSRAEAPIDAVLLAVAESTEELARTLTDALGREKAARAVTYGVACVDEAILFAPAPRRDDDPT